MCKALIIGAGGVGTVVTQKIAANPVFTDVMLASRTKSKCDAVAAAIGGNRVKTAEVDADSVPQLCELFRAFKPDIVVNVALPYQDLTIMDACLATKTHYIDTANYEPEDTAKFEYKWQWAYRKRYEEAGITALLGSGFDPGVTGVFSAYALGLPKAGGIRAAFLLRSSFFAAPPSAMMTGSMEVGSPYSGSPGAAMV